MGWCFLRYRPIYVESHVLELAVGNIITLLRELDKTNYIVKNWSKYKKFSIYHFKAGSYRIPIIWLQSFEVVFSSLNLNRIVQMKAKNSELRKCFSQKQSISYRFKLSVSNVYQIDVGLKLNGLCTLNEPP